MTIGERIKQLRGKKNQKDFAQACGISDSTISKLESGQLTGTLDLHRMICKAAGISLSTLYKGVYEDEISPAEPAPSCEEKPFNYNELVTARFLTKNIFLNKKMLPEIVLLEPQGEARDELPADTQRFLYVLEGEVEINIGDNVYQLKPGAPFYITDASIPHSVKNTGALKAKLLRVTTPVRL